MRIVNAAYHAIERYRIHVPDAETRDVLAAATVAIPIPSPVAHALAGRPLASAQPGRDAAEHRVDLAGRGIFVVVPLREDPSLGYVHTYLRLDAVEQRARLREWYLDPLEVVREVFAQGFAAGRDPEVGEQRAFEARQPALVALARRLGAAAAAQEGAAREGARPRPPAPSAGEGGERAAPIDDPATRDGPFRWSSTALADLRMARAHHAGLSSSVRSWRWLDHAGVERIAEFRHLQLPREPWGALVSPCGKAGATVVAREGGFEVVRVFSVPQADRIALLAARVPGGVDAPALVQLARR